ncbi:MAG: YbaB/EbfC family nucleoid-associated protein [Chloroflexota bacterium]|nr:YbaB/EbfC family nucleoid-associated protein [Chloroflexota bacterium]MDE2840306.1 YbaB/EbfC family nucleoid-associated protein [Chloroflexota bacterium]MDE2931303.1 YbaB/EbfC family nucleoid-associated protein [Chloroflexota bacterium]
MSMKMLRQMQQKMTKIQEELERETVESTAGGGAVKVVMTGHQKVHAIEILPDVLEAAVTPEGEVDEEGVAMLQDLLVAAVNDAVAKSQELAGRRLSAVTGGMNIPGLT